MHNSNIWITLNFPRFELGMQEAKQSHDMRVTRLKAKFAEVSYSRANSNSLVLATLANNSRAHNSRASYSRASYSRANNSRAKHHFTSPSPPV